MAETQVSESSMYGAEINLNNQSQDSVIKEQDTESQSFDLITLNHNSNIRKHSSDESSSLTIETSLHNSIQ